MSVVEGRAENICSIGVIPVLDPKQTLMDFLQSTYAAAAETGKWDRAELECALGEAGRPRVA
jgi:hypothetical protein